MSKRVWVVGGGFVAGLVLVGGLYELNRLVNDYASLSSPTVSTVAALPAGDGVVDASELDTDRTDKAERRRLRRERRAEGTAAVTDAVPAVANPMLQSAAAPIVRTQLRPDQLADASRPDVRALKRRARLHRRGSRGAPDVEAGAAYLNEIAPPFPTAIEPAAIEPIEP